MVTQREDVPESVNQNGYIPPPTDNKGGKIAQFAIMFVIAVITVVGMNAIFYKYVSKADFDTNLGNVASDISTMQSSVTQISVIQQLSETNKNNISAMDRRIATLENKSSTPIDMSIYARLSDLNEIRNSVNGGLTNNSTITTLQNQVKVLSDYNITQDKLITDLQTKVTELSNSSSSSTNTSTTTTTAEGLVVDIRDLGTEILAGDFNFYGGDSIKLSLTNKGTKDITDLRLYLYLHPEPTLSPTMLDATDGVMSISGDIACTLISASPDEYKFKTSRIAIAAGKTKNYYLTPSVTVKPKYAYRDKYTGIETNSATTPTVPADGTTQNNPLNTTPSVSKLVEDTIFYPLYEVIDYNVSL